MDSELHEVVNGAQIDAESPALGASGGSAEGKHYRERRRNWNVPPGGVITTGAGYLSRYRRDTPHHQWSKVPVGPVAAQELSEGLDERDHLILLIAEQLGMVTTEQIERALFDSSVTARNHMRLLRGRRFLASPEVDHRMASAAVGHRAGTHNASLVLDWNGKYLLESLHYDLRTWDPSTVAQVNSQFGHTLGVSEVWSYIVAAARATHEPLPFRASSEHAQEQAGARDQLAVGLLNERESVVYYGGCTGWSLEMEGVVDEVQPPGTAGATSSKRDRKLSASKLKALLKPDASLVLSVTSDETERAYREATSKSNSKSPCSYRGSWRDALLTAIPSPASMRAAEHLGSTRYRLVFLEMETGSNSSKDVIHKIERYNQLYKRLKPGDAMQGQNWQALFGPTVPPIVVAVRDSSQVDGQVMLWRTHYAPKSSGALILANLELLSLAYAKGRYSLLTQPCWLDVMRPEGPKRKTLGEIFGLRL